MNRTKITAHRGCCKNHIENTIPAFQEALRLGCDRIEFDVHYSSDKKLVVHHDYLVAVSNGEHRPIIEVNSADLSANVALLEDVLEITNGRVGLEIELKGCSTHFVEAVLARLKQNNVLDLVEITSPHPYVLSYLRSREESVRLGMFVSPFPEWMPKVVGYQLIVESLDLGELDVAHCPVSVLNRGFVDELRRRGKFIHAANCNSRAELEEAYRLGVDQLSTDELQLALSLRAS
jgi:glycerophosphoryl diester phosphodiesterase